MTSADESEGPATTFRRVPFVEAEADSVVAFCVANGCPHDAALARRLLCRMTSDPSGVLVWADDDGPAIVATVIDRAVNGAGAASLEILGARAPLGPEVLWERIVAPAIEFARHGPRRALHVSLYPWLIAPGGGTEQDLRARGFGLAYASFIMRRPPDADAAPADPTLEAGWRWSPLDDARAEEGHAAIARSFAGAPSLSLSPLEDFQRALATAPDIWRALLDGERIAGLVRVVDLGDGSGKVGMVGRVPEYRGRGLGPRLLAEGLRVLAARGAYDVTLDVDAENERALDLYRRFGFEVVSRTPVLSLSFAGRDSERAAVEASHEPEEQ